MKQEPRASITGCDVKFSEAMSSMPFLHRCKGFQPWSDLAVVAVVLWLIEQVPICCSGKAMAPCKTSLTRSIVAKCIFQI